MWWPSNRWMMSRPTRAGSDLLRLREEIDRLFSPGEAPPEVPPLRVYQSSDSATLTAELPGVGAGDLEVSVLDDTLTLKGGKRLEEVADDGVRYHRRERSHGEFTRSLRMPWRINGDGVTADLKNGVLTLVVPRDVEDRTTRITVRSS